MTKKVSKDEALKAVKTITKEISEIGRASCRERV